jgi:hypothetical protein
VRGDIQDNNGNTHTRWEPKGILVGVDGLEFIDVSGESIPKGRHNKGHEEDETGSERLLRPCFQ